MNRRPPPTTPAARFAAGTPGRKARRAVERTARTLSALRSVEVPVHDVLARLDKEHAIGWTGSGERFLDVERTLHVLEAMVEEARAGVASAPGARPVEPGALPVFAAAPALASMKEGSK